MEVSPTSDWMRRETSSMVAVGDCMRSVIRMATWGNTGNDWIFSTQVEDKLIFLRIGRHTRELEFKGSRAKQKGSALEDRTLLILHK